MKKILVIEDNDLLRENIGEILEMEGYEIDTAENGQVGIDKAMVMKPDLIVSDINMPEVDGFGVLAKLREDPSTKTIPFIFLTVKNSLKDMRNGMNLGANDYLTKPFDMTELLNAVEKRLKMREDILEKELERYNKLKNAVGMPLATVIDDPLKSIEHMAELVKGEIDELSKEEIIEITALMGNNAKNLRREIIKILMFYRVEALQNNTSDLEELKKLVTEKPSVKIKNISEEVAFSFNRSTDLNLHTEDMPIQFPEEFLSFIVKELVENAFKFSAKNCAVKVIGEQKDNQFELTVQDKGIGFPMKNLNEIAPYEKFQEVHRQGDGLGLGLYDVVQLVGMFNGKIHVSSEEGMGSSFQIKLPTV